MSSAGKPAGRRRFDRWVMHAPATIRALVRGEEVWLAVLAALVGVLAAGPGFR